VLSPVAPWHCKRLDFDGPTLGFGRTTSAVARKARIRLQARDSGCLAAHATAFVSRFACIWRSGEEEGSSACPTSVRQLTAAVCVRFWILQNAIFVLVLQLRLEVLTRGAPSLHGRPRCSPLFSMRCITGPAVQISAHIPWTATRGTAATNYLSSWPRHQRERQTDLPRAVLETSRAQADEYAPAGPAAEGRFIRTPSPVCDSARVVCPRSPPHRLASRRTAVGTSPG
jgi:hypothetical protein